MQVFKGEAYLDKHLHKKHADTIPQVRARLRRMPPFHARAQPRCMAHAGMPAAMLATSSQQRHRARALGRPPRPRRAPPRCPPRRPAQPNYNQIG